jgi:hypothetical protein
MPDFGDIIEEEMGWLEAELTDILSDGAFAISLTGGLSAYHFMGLPTKTGRKYLSFQAQLKSAVYRAALEQGGSLVREAFTKKEEFRPWLSDFVSKTATSTKDAALMAYNEGKGIEGITDAITSAFDVAESRARLIAFQESKKLYIESERAAFQDHNVQRVVWHHLDGVEDPREEHVSWDGEEMDVDDPRLDELGDFNCHCWIEPVVDTAFTSSNDTEAEAESRPKKFEEKLLSSRVKPVETFKDYDKVKNIWQNRQMEYTTTKATLDSRYNNAIRYREEWMKANASGADEDTKSAIYQQYSKAVDEYNAKVGEFNKLRTDIRVSARNAIFPEKLIDVTPNISTQQYKAKLDPNFIKNVKTGTGQIEKMVNLKDIDGMKVPIKMLPPERDRAYATGDGRLFLTKDIDPAVVIHEFGHKLESSVPEIHKEALSFLERRTAGEEAKSLIELTGVKEFGADEIAKKDNFMDPYIGKLYNHEATEVVSMGMQYMYERPVEFAIKDPDHFNFILKVMGRTE